MKELNFNSKTWTIVFILLAYLFGIYARMYWISWAGEFDEMIHNGALMINTNDGYAFAEVQRGSNSGISSAK